MQVDVLYFASLKEKSASPGYGFSAGLKHRWPIKTTTRYATKTAVLLDKQLLVAVNHSIVGDAQVLKDKDEVAFLPPITGG